MLGGAILGLVITWRGREYGPAQEVADLLGVTVDNVRDWGRRGLVARYHRPGRGRGTTYYRLDEAAETERATRLSRTGRRRRAHTLAA